MTYLNSLKPCILSFMFEAVNANVRLYDVGAAAKSLVKELEYLQGLSLPLLSLLLLSKIQINYKFSGGEWRLGHGSTKAVF